MVAKVKVEECTGCGICVEECPSSAIEIVDEVAKVNEDECNECGTCVDECPNEAIFLE